MSAPEFLPGILDGTVHRVENGHRTGVMWGPSVEGNWYASRAAVNQGETYKFAEQRYADAFLHAPIDTSAVFVGHIHCTEEKPCQIADTSPAGAPPATPIN